MNPQLDCDLIAIDRRKELDTARASEAMLREALKIMVKSAVPHPVEHPTMTAAWKVADAALSGSSGEWLERHDVQWMHAIAQRIATIADLTGKVSRIEAERDGLAEQLHNVRDSLLAYFSGSFLDNNIFTDEYKVTLAAHDALIATEARRKALLEAYERVKNLRGCNAYDVIDSIEEMAKESDHG